MILVQSSKVYGWKSGLGWTALAQMLSLFVKLGSTLVLTRLLAPDAYALVGTAMIVLTTLEWLTDFGVVPALLRHPNGHQPEWLLVGWWIGIGRGVGLSLLAMVAVLPLSRWYHQPELHGLMMALAMRPFLMALRSPAFPELRRRIDARKLLLDEFAQTLIGTLVAIGIAWSFPTAGAWAIVFGTLAAAISGIVSSYLMTMFKPRWYWDSAVAKELAGVGWQVLLNTIFMALWLNSDRILGSKLMPLNHMGLYIVAWNLASVVEGFLTRGTDVYFAILMRQPTENRSRWHREHATQVVSIALVFCLIAAVLTGPLVRLVYDDRYRAVSPILLLLMVRLMLRFVGQLDFQILLAQGQIRCVTFGYAVAALVQLVSILVLAPYGGLGLAVGLFFSSAIVTAVPLCVSPLLPGGGKRLALALVFAFLAVLIGLHL